MVIEINKPYIIFCEGADDVPFFNSLLSSMNLKDEIQVIGLHEIENREVGKGDFMSKKGVLSYLLDANKNFIKKFGIIFDADTNKGKNKIENVKKEIEEMIGKCDYKKDSFGVFALPNDADKGGLESLKLEYYKQFGCINEFIKCIEGNPKIKTYKPKEKVDIYENCIKVAKMNKNLGYPIEKFDNECFQSLKEFINKLFKLQKS